MTKDFRRTTAVYLVAIAGMAVSPAHATAATDPAGAAAPKSAVEGGTPPASETTTPGAGPRQEAAAPGASPAGDAHAHTGGAQDAPGAASAPGEAGPGAASTPGEECPCHEHDAQQHAEAQPADAAQGSPATEHACPHHGDGPCPCQSGTDPAAPDEGSGRLPTGEPHNAPPQRLVLTLAPAALGTFQATSTWRAGGVLMIAVPVAWHELELQVDLGFFGGPAGLASGLDFLVKHPFRVGDAWRPYIGIGPSISLERLNTEPRDVSTSTFGVTGTGGAYYWFTGECAVMAYAQYTAVFAKQFRNALQLGLGITYAFTSAP